MKTILLVPRLAMFLEGMKFYGLSEVPGKENNPHILKFFKDLGHEWVEEEDVSWCSAFINWLAWSSGIEHTGKLDARSWLNVGRNKKYPQLGDIVVFWRVNPTDWRGHVGLYAGENDSHIYVLGGNQSNQVNITPYPKSQFLGYRELNYV